MLECTYSNDQTIDWSVDANVKPESILQNGQKKFEYFKHHLAKQENKG